MPQSFRALADHVGEVADLLTHAQADLPNWWKGPAADQAAATLGRAAAEAREFHGSALAAAAAVSRCAQVVAEQQHQMMNVPEAPEPGVTDVVRRPATPFEALEAARQDASYQAAHEQAVQVVNGIAAQYVETRRQLSNIGAFRAENFDSSTGALSDPKSNIEDPLGSISRSSEPTATRRFDFGKTQYAPPGKARNTETTISTGSRNSTRSPHHAVGEPGSNVEDPASVILSSHRAADRAIDNEAADPAQTDASGRQTEYGPSISASHVALGDTNNTQPTSKAATPEDIPDEYTPPSYLRPSGALSRPAANHSDSAAHNPRAYAISRKSSPSAFSQRQPENTEKIEYDIPPDGKMSLSPSLQATHEMQSDALGSENSAIIPQYSGVGAGHRSDKERNPRPAYLKERKSVWQPDTVAAPADGILTPDWFEHQ
ncbi:hypothetical protein [Catenulispora sp. GAS73]|uniref:hypothetical protein n=1 Tax=Catenulispora sp. GAS73 TaxID=3156269 RepID=UPI003515E005